ncbi:ABC transporter substrate-binding protein [Bacillus niameyensis]|uniref:ABC transporter substrate-binding protein n=1 Tax=Bacillus niameyensis TaxID=1522308 RepID=UPI000785CC9D|nr:ABC transporter substrate-binding protein [Bacillus niameyensis]
MSQRSKIIYIFIGFMVLLLAACGSESASSNDVIKIGVAGPLTGGGAEYGRDFKEGSELAVELFNKSGGYEGKQVEIVFGDDKNEPKEAASVAQSFASNKDIKAVMGHWSSSTAFAGIPIYNRNELPYIIATASHPDLTSPDTEWVFRSSTTQILEGKNLADFAVNQLEKKNIAVLYVNSDWGKANAQYFKQFAEEYGANISVYESYPPGEAIDYTAALTKVKDSEPDLLFLGSLYTEGILIIKQAKELGIDVDIMGTTTFNSDGFLAGGDVVEGVYLNSLFVPTAEGELIQKFVADFKEKFGKEPSYFNALAYDATTILLEGIKNGGTTREGIRDAMADIYDFPVVTGVVQFNENRDDVNKPYYNLVVKNGKFELVQ